MNGGQQNSKSHISTPFPTTIGATWACWNRVTKYRFALPSTFKLHTPAQKHRFLAHEITAYTKMCTFTRAKNESVIAGIPSSNWTAEAPGHFSAQPISPLPDYPFGPDSDSDPDDYYQEGVAKHPSAAFQKKTQTLQRTVSTPQSTRV